MSEQTPAPSVVDYQSPPSVSAGGDFWQKLLRPRFVATVIILAIAACGWYFAKESLRLTFHKNPVPPRQHMVELPETLGSWVRVWQDDNVGEDMIEGLGTTDYLFAEYVNYTALYGGRRELLLKRFEGKTPDEKRKEVARIRAENPAAVLNVSVTYYTGKADTVAHVPEVCYVAGGYRTEQAENKTWRNVLSEGRSLPVRFLNFQNQPGVTRSGCTVAYTFHVNGGYQGNSLMVRLALQNLRARHAYYSKVELMSLVPKSEEAAESMQDFLRAGLPALEKMWPDWSQYQ